MNKYRSERVAVGNEVFDSKHEMRRWIELCFLLRAGKISDLRRQVPFELIPAQKRDGKVIERPVKYVADFVYKDSNGETVVEDAKSVATRTKEYVIKRKLMLWEFGLRVIEV